MNTPGTNAFALNPADYGLPTREELRKLRIWDMHYHGLWEGNLRKHEETLVYVERMGIERVLSLDIAGTPADRRPSEVRPCVSRSPTMEPHEYLLNRRDVLAGAGVPISREFRALVPSSMVYRT